MSASKSRTADLLLDSIIAQAESLKARTELDHERVMKLSQSARALLDEVESEERGR